MHVIWTIDLENTTRLAILKINGEELLGARDDGAFLDILKSFFQYIGQREDIDKGKNGPHIKMTVRRHFALYTIYDANQILFLRV